MKLKGQSNRAISQAAGIKLKTIQNITTRGGRLHLVIESLRSEKSKVVQKSNLSAWDQLCAAKDPAIEELRHIANDDPNTAARLKAIDMILDLTGVRVDDKPPLLDPSNMGESCDRLLKWLNEQLLRIFREIAPQAALIDRKNHSLENLILPYGYQLEKYIHWRHGLDQEDVNEWLKSSGWDIEKMESLLKELSEPSDSWRWLCENPEKAEVLRKAVEKDRLRRKELLVLIARTTYRHILLLSEAIALDENAQAIRDLIELLTVFSEMTKEEIDEYIRGLKRVNQNEKE